MTLTTRIEKLETENTFLRKCLVHMQAVLEANVDDDRLLVAIEDNKRSNRIGRPQLLSDHDLKSRLRDLLLLLSPHVWPRFKTAIKQARDPDTLAALLQRKCPNREGDPVFQRLLMHRKELWAFTRSDRYTGRCEQIARAMAGVPELKPRSSYDRCSKFPPIDLTDDPYRLRL
jgi:hypothetical protein